MTALGTYFNNQYQGVSLVENGYTAGAKLNTKSRVQSRSTPAIPMNG